MLKILLVEDNPVDALIVKRAFESLEPDRFELVHVATLQEALSSVNDAMFHAVLLDLGLPDSTGVGSIRKLLDRIPDCPVIVLTGIDDTSVETEGIKLGAQEFLNKNDVQPSQIIRAIRNAALRKLHVMKLLSEASSGTVQLDPHALEAVVRESTSSITQKTNDLLSSDLTPGQSELVTTIEREARNTLSTVRNLVGESEPELGDVVDVG